MNEQQSGTHKVVKGDSAITAWNTRHHTEHQRALDALEVAREFIERVNEYGNGGRGFERGRKALKQINEILGGE